jgi:hypothetical protein
VWVGFVGANVERGRDFGELVVSWNGSESSDFLFGQRGYRVTGFHCAGGEKLRRVLASVKRVVASATVGVLPETG